MEINKQNLVNSVLKVGSRGIYTGSVGAILYDVLKSKTNKDIEKLKKRIDTLEKSNKKYKIGSFTELLIFYMSYNERRFRKWESIKKI